MKTLVSSFALSALFCFGLAQTAAPAQRSAQGNIALVRVAHLSPNAEQVSISLTGTGQEGQQLSPEELSNLTYRDLTEYMEVPAQTYDVVVETPSGPLQETLTFNAGVRYTVAAIGLAVPEELAQQDENDGGFFSFLNNLFTTEENRLEFALRLISLEDDVVTTAGGTAPGLAAPQAPGTPAQPGTATQPGTPRQTGQTQLEQLVFVRLVHAAPGTAPVSLGPVDTQANTLEPTAFVSSLAFGETSGFNTVNRQEANNLRVSLDDAGTGALSFSLTEASLEPGSLHTLFVIGTPTEVAPLEVRTVSSPVLPQQAAGTAPRTPTMGSTMTGGTGQQAESSATAQLQDTKGNQVGNATFTATQDGAVRVQVELSDFEPGEYGLHFHETGQCSPNFDAAGDHFNPTDAGHGLLNPDGPHVGDLPNLTVVEPNAAVSEGSATPYIVTTKLVTLGEGEASLFDDDGSSVILHAQADDYITDPTGNSGDRIACGVITQAQTGGQ